MRICIYITNSKYAIITANIRAMMATITDGRQKGVIPMHYTLSHSLNPAFTDIHEGIIETSLIQYLLSGKLLEIINYLCHHISTDNSLHFWHLL
jgi:hypothetical protein